MVCITVFKKHHKLSRVEREVEGPGAQLSKRTNTYIKDSSLKNIRLTGPQLAALLNGTRKNTTLDVKSQLLLAF